MTRIEAIKLERDIRLKILRESYKFEKVYRSISYPQTQHDRREGVYIRRDI